MTEPRSTKPSAQDAQTASSSRTAPATVLATRPLMRWRGIDLITAAVAEYHGAVVLHYDADFEHIAEVTGQPQTWVVPRGSID